MVGGICQAELMREAGTRSAQAIHGHSEGAHGQYENMGVSAAVPYDASHNDEVLPKDGARLARPCQLGAQL